MKKENKITVLECGGRGCFKQCEGCGRIWRTGQTSPCDETNCLTDLIMLKGKRKGWK